MDPAANTSARGFVGHPRGLATLFFTEMWERFSYYGMRALLILFMTEATTSTLERDGVTVPHAGLGLDVATAGAIYGLYTSLVYIMGLPGGWVADNLWGQRKAVFVGGCIITLGHFTMAVPTTSTFFLGLVFVILGTGLLKPNVSTIVGELYPASADARRDAGFSIFYMGINLGAFLGPLVTGWLGEGYNWHWGFGAAGVGMLFGLVQYRLTEGYLGNAGLLKTGDEPTVTRRKSLRFFAAFGLVATLVAVFGWLVSEGVVAISIQEIARVLGFTVLGLVALYFVYVWLFGGHTKGEVRGTIVIFWLFLLVAVFWSGFEQAGTSFNLFARDATDRSLPEWIPFLSEIPAAFFQSINALFIIILAPVFGGLWVWLDRRGRNPSIPLKAAMGLLGLALGFLVIAWGAANASPGNLVSPSWLVVMYFLHTVGELCISPIGLSAVTKLAPVSRVGQMMGVWFVGAALGNLFAGIIAGSGLENQESSELFRSITYVIGGVGIFALVLSRPVRSLMDRGKEPDAV